MMCFLGPEGEILAELPEFARQPKQLIPLYRAMVLTRRFDAKAVSLQRTGRLGTYPSSLGEEASMVGLAAGMRDSDVLLPSYRQTGALFWRGVTPLEVLLYWGGDERGSDYGGPREDFPISVPVGTHALHAVGVAYAFKLRREARAAVAAVGDGATSKGDMLEAMNFAGVWRVPTVFVAVNNQWAISVPLDKQTASETLAQKALAFGIRGERVDGNDVIAVRHAMETALARARAGDGATLIETVTYRLSDHTTADDAGRYRSPEAASAQWKNDPLARVRSLLANEGGWTKADEEALIGDVDSVIEEAVAAYETTPPLPPEAMFDHLYGKLPEAFAEQRSACRRGAEGGDDA
jgi:pyruvate dehydrogenase E1 component alpha subunit